MALNLTTGIPRSQWGTHITHCCKNHGCKYGDTDCPVVLNLAFQKFRCEFNHHPDPCHDVNYYFKELVHCLTEVKDNKHYPSCIFYFKEKELYFVYNSSQTNLFTTKKVFDTLEKYGYTTKNITDLRAFIVEKMGERFKNINDDRYNIDLKEYLSQDVVNTITKLVLNK